MHLTSKMELTGQKLSNKVLLYLYGTIIKDFTQFLVYTDFQKRQNFVLKKALSGPNSDFL